MSDSNREKVSFVKEVSYGVNPGGTFTPVRFTSESIRQATQTTSSQEIRNDRNIPDLLRTGINAEGDINIELSYGSHFELMEYTLESAAWTGTVDVASVDFTFASTGGVTGTITRASGDFTATTPPFIVGKWVEVSGMTTVSGANGWWKLTAVTATVATVTGYKTMAAGTDTGGASKKVTLGGQIANGTTQSSITIEKYFTDLAGGGSEYEISTGMTPGGFNLSLAADQIVTGSFSFLGKSCASSATAAGSGYGSESTGSVMSGVDNVIGILEGGIAVSITAFTLQLQNNLRPRLEVGNLGATSIGSGSCVVTGTLKFYYTTKTIIDKYLAGTASTLSLVFYDSAGQAMVIELPNIKYTSGQRVAGGQNQDIMVEMGFQAIYSSTAANLHTIRIVRFA